MKHFAKIVGKVLLAALWLGVCLGSYRLGFLRGWTEDEVRLSPFALSFRLSLHEMASALQNRAGDTKPVGWSVYSTWDMLWGSVYFHDVHARRFKALGLENPQYLRDLERARVITERNPEGYDMNEVYKEPRWSRLLKGLL